MTSQLHRLMAAHDTALAAYDAREDDYDKENDATGHELDRARDAILAHRPTLGEIPVKAAFMLRNRTFTEWDDFDQRKLVEALSPVSLMRRAIRPAAACPRRDPVPQAPCERWITITRMT